MSGKTGFAMKLSFICFVSLAVAILFASLPSPNKQAQLSQFLSPLSDNPWEHQVDQ